MGWKDDLAALVEQTTRAAKLLQVLHGQIALNTRRLEEMKIVMESQIGDQSRSADRMADRMIEMAMVRQGSPEMAATHRRTLSEKRPEGVDLWQDNPETAWPPPGHDAISMP